MPKGIYKRTIEHKKKLKENHKGMKGKTHNIKTKIKMSISHKNMSIITKNKMRKSHIGIKKEPHTEETKRKIGKANSISLKGRRLNIQHKKKIRISAFNYVKNKRNILYPCIGHNEKQILDELEKIYNYKVIRQFECEGYFIDGYIPELNLAIEIDERCKNKIKDIERQKIIEDKLGCKFLRINDYD